MTVLSVVFIGGIAVGFATSVSRTLGASAPRDRLKAASLMSNVTLYLTWSASSTSTSLVSGASMPG